MDEVRRRIEAVFRQESGRIIAGLIRLTDSFDLAEEAIQEAFAAALVHWPETDLPENPAAWITIAARRKLIDQSRRERTRDEKSAQLLYETKTSTEQNDEITEVAAMDFPDDRLRLIFTCCHPALNQEAQIALTLRTLGGLTTSEISRAFLLPEPTLAQRLVRAKRKIQDAKIPYEIPSQDRLPERLESVETVIYLIFNEGYSSTAGDTLIRRELCSEAIRLARTLCELMPDEPEVRGLLALMLLHDSRRDARVNAQGELVPLEEQDRSQWHKVQIDEGRSLIEAALRAGEIGPYQLQAAISAVHAEAATPELTDWPQIAALYRELAKLSDSAVVSLNFAVAIAMAEGLERGLALIDDLGSSSELDSYYLYHAARADLLRRLGKKRQASVAYRQAISITTNAIERRYLKRRLAEVESSSEEV